jgi:triacylglycerol lipase
VGFSTFVSPHFCPKIIVIAAVFPVFLLAGCASVPEANPEIPPLRYPVVLVHGMAVRDGKSVGSWGRIPDLLRSYGVDLYYGGTDGWGTYETNAKFLKEKIETILRETGKERVNIIAYSTGGIDARYLIWKYNFGEQVASLTTIGTPHQGSELADFACRQKILHTRFGKKLLAGLGKVNRDIDPDPYELAQTLTSEKMEEFNATVIPDPQVYYLVVHSTMKGYWDDPLFGFSRWYINRKTGKNDGIVSEESTHWYGDVVNVGDRVSHFELVDSYKNNADGTDVLELYIDILERLGNYGF